MLKSLAQIAIFIVVAFAAIGFSARKNDALQIQEVNIDLTSEGANYFVEEEEIHELIAESSYGNINNVKASVLNLKSLENKIESHHHIKEAEVFQDLKGALTVKVTEHQPIARIFNRNGKDLYIGSEGELIPESSKYTSRVTLLEFENTPDLQRTIKEIEIGTELLSFLQFIKEDNFWNAQIANILIDKSNEIIIYPQVTKQTVEFGSLEGFEGKLKKLMLFYKEILPRKGWNTYARVNLKYKNQIVCE